MTQSTNYYTNPSTTSLMHFATPCNSLYHQQSQCNVPGVFECVQMKTPITPANNMCHVSEVGCQTPLDNSNYYTSHQENYSGNCNVGLSEPFNGALTPTPTYNASQSYANHTVSQTNSNMFRAHLPRMANSPTSSFLFVSSNCERDEIRNTTLPCYEPTCSMYVPSVDTDVFNVNWNKLNRRKEKCLCINCVSMSQCDADGKRLHVCHVENCGKVYYKMSHLNAHLRGHNGDRPFVCMWQQCGKSFTRSDELQRHWRTHTGEKKYKCDKCEKRFMRSDHCKKHEKTHDNKKSK
ncbi:transcription factor Sp3-like [Harpegnathos saltator]|uniref:transcription factor Sp3-like n=1 Tax=Harpegnathos saltator TaxID=610380 RepID=UPI000DBEEB0D|nr:transcription factor Sp3-like [Harpegnathos saltator]XP_025155661.1 transcription factor Sp3-like [Harpegnathos saltator]